MARTYSAETDSGNSSSYQSRARTVRRLRMLPSATTADPVSAAELAQWLQSEWSTEVLVVDCRPFMVYNSSHIRSAHNVHCPPILKRRTGGAMPLENIVRCPKTRVKLLSGVFKSVVLYDDCTRCLTELSPDSNIAIVLKSIRNGAGFQSVYFLEGTHAY